MVVDTEAEDKVKAEAKVKASDYKIQSQGKNSFTSMSRQRTTQFLEDPIPDLTCWLSKTTH